MKNLTKKQETFIKKRIKKYIDAGWIINELVFSEIAEKLEIDSLVVHDYYKYVINQ